MSAVIRPSQTSRQLTLEFAPGLTERFRFARDAVAQGVYQRGLKKTAIIYVNTDFGTDWAPGNLSVALGDDGTRKFGLDDFERYIEVTGDLTPLYFLVEKYLGDKSATRDQALPKAVDLLQGLPELLHQAGIGENRRRR